MAVGARRKDDLRVAALRAVHRDIAAFRPRGFGPPVHGPAVASRIFLLGQAPGPHEARLGRPFAWTAGKTLFRWLERATGADEETVRARVYIAAVVRCFPGKTRGGGDRVPTAEECGRWRGFVAREVEILRPRLVLPVGRLAIQEVLGHTEPIAAVVGRLVRTQFHGVDVDVIPLPHPSGASTWFKVEPGRTLLDRALGLLAEHPEVVRALGGRDERRGSRMMHRRAQAQPDEAGQERAGDRGAQGVPRHDVARGPLAGGGGDRVSPRHDR